MVVRNVSSLKALDALVKEEWNRVKIPKGWNASFNAYEWNPGEGHVEISSWVNNVRFVYHEEPKQKITLQLENSTEKIMIHADEGVLSFIQLNDRSYHNPNDKFGQIQRHAKEALDAEASEYGIVFEPKKSSERDQEVAEAVNFGINALNTVKKYLSQNVSELVKLADGYFSRSLMDLSAQPAMKTTKEIIDTFDLRLPEKA